MLMGYSPSLKEAQEETQGRNMKAGTEAKAMGGLAGGGDDTTYPMPFIGLLLMAWSTCFLI